jgi:hypothetical protein
MAGIGNKIKEAADEAAKDKMVRGDKKGKKRAGGSQSGRG